MAEGGTIEQSAGRASEKPQQEIKVRVAQLGKGIFNLNAPASVPVRYALLQAGIHAEGMDVRVNGKPVTMETMLVNGDLLTVVPQIKGGSYL